MLCDHCTTLVSHCTASRIYQTFTNRVDDIRCLYPSILSAFDVRPCLSLLELLQRPGEELPILQSELVVSDIEAVLTWKLSHGIGRHRGDIPDPGSLAI